MKTPLQHKKTNVHADHREVSASPHTLQAMADNRPDSARLRQLIQLAAKSPLQHKKTNLHADHREVTTSPHALQAMADNRPDSARLRQLMQLAAKSPVQRMAFGASSGLVTQRVGEEETAPSQRGHDTVAPARANGLPAQLQRGIESLSRMSMAHVNVHYNSSQPAQLNAHAFAQGRDIHVAPGQERHLPHEAWHVVQQAKGRVRPTLQMNAGVPVNDDKQLEHEADVMGEKAMQLAASETPGKSLVTPPGVISSSAPLQRRTLAQAGLDAGMAAVNAQPMAPGSMGHPVGIAYTRNIGPAADKQAALAASGASYAAFSATVPLTQLLDPADVATRITTTQDAITPYLSGINQGAAPAAAAMTDAEILAHIKTNILGPAVLAIKDDTTDADLDALLHVMRQPMQRNAVNQKVTYRAMGAVTLRDFVLDQVNHHGWRNGNPHVRPVDPFIYRTAATINGAAFAMSYQHSPDWPGYVVRTEADGHDAGMHMNARSVSNVAGVPAGFSRLHHETEYAMLANDLDLNAADAGRVNERRMDSMTKLAGEGARFRCVRNHMAVMSDKSRFYVVSGGQAWFVTLEDLWSSWADVFNKANDIDNATVRNAILNSGRWNYDFKKNRYAREFDAGYDLVWGPGDINLT